MLGLTGPFTISSVVFSEPSGAAVVVGSIALIGTFASGGCIIDELTNEDRPCARGRPCAPGYVCDLKHRVCVRSRRRDAAQPSDSRGPASDGSQQAEASPRDLSPQPDKSGADAKLPPDRGGPDAGCGSLSYCSGSCVDLKKNNFNCGKCGKRCAAGTYCSRGACCRTGLVNCSGTCVNTASDSRNCGKCGTKCNSPATCVSSKCQAPAKACADGSEEQTFGSGMRGCAGKVTFAQRASLCASGFRVCTAAEWVSRRGSTAPSYSYWTNDNLRYNGTVGACYVSVTAGSLCSGGAEPMRVCSGSVDPLGNTCQWVNCGLNTITPNQYFGGCINNTTAGALCCPK